MNIHKCRYTYYNHSSYFHDVFPSRVLVILYVRVALEVISLQKKKKFTEFKFETFEGASAKPKGVS